MMALETVRVDLADGVLDYSDFKDARKLVMQRKASLSDEQSTVNEGSELCSSSRRLEPTRRRLCDLSDCTIRLLAQCALAPPLAVLCRVHPR